MMGFTIHERKSVLIPTQKTEFLGFLIDSRNMSISINEEKVDTLILKIRKFLNISAPTIRQLSSIIGSVISLFPAIPLGRLHYRALEREKNSLLRKAGGNFDVKINSLNEFVKDDLNWWLESIPKAMADILLPEVDFIINNTDASESGWGATNNISPNGGILDNKDKEYHINYLELKAFYLAIKAYKCSWEGC